jgi:hypothetical protein
MKLQIDKGYVNKKENKNIFLTLISLCIIGLAWYFHIKWIILLWTGFLIGITLIWLVFVYSIGDPRFQELIISSDNSAKYTYYLIKMSVLKLLAITSVSLITYAYFSLPVLFIVTWINLGLFLAFKEHLNKIFRANK